MSYYVIHSVYLSIIAAAFITGSIYYRKRHPEVLPVIIILGYTLLSQSASFYAAIRFRNNLPVDHVFMWVSTALWGWFYYRNIEGDAFRRLIKIITPILCILFVVNTFFIQGFNSFPGNPMKIVTLFNPVWGAVLLVQKLDLPAGENVFKNPIFVIAIGLVWFNIISSLYFFLWGFLAKYKVDSTIIYTIHIISNYVYYLLFLVSMLFLKKYKSDARQIRK